MTEYEIKIFCEEWLSRCGARYDETFEGSGDWVHLEVNVIRDMVEMHKAGQVVGAADSQKLIQLLNQKVKLLQTALREIRDFDDDSEWDNPGEIAKQALTIQ